MSELSAIPDEALLAEADRRAKLFSRKRAPIHSASQLYFAVRGRLASAPEERLVVVLVDIRLRLIDSIEVFKGGLRGMDIHPREVFAEAVRLRAAGIFLAHNHPSGNPDPSKEDVATTVRLVQIGDLLGIPVHDHIVVAGQRYVSLRASTTTWSRAANAMVSALADET